MMTGLTRWTHGTDPLRDRFNRLFEHAFGDSLSLSPLAATEEVSNRRWLPAVDIEETSDAFVFTCELPGMNKEDVSITLENNVLTVSGERKFQDEERQRNFYRVERAHGAFSRSFTLPSNVKPDEVNASFQDGMLMISIPKVEEAKPRQIQIR